jgi:hypothetical protein
MSALSFLGGLSGAYTAIDKGIKADEDRQQQLKDREYQAQQRQYEQGQQKRKLDEQARADKLREDDAAVATTETVQTDLMQQPGAVQMDDDGNQMPAVIKTETRKRGMHDIYRDYAANRRKAQDTAGALEFEQKGIKVAAELANRQASTLISQSAAMTFEQYAQGAAKLFNNDSLPQSISKITPMQNGEIQVEITHNDNGQSQVVTFKNKDELTRTLRAQYQPETHAKMLEAQNKVALELEAKKWEMQNDPTKRYLQVKPGTTVYDSVTGKSVIDNTMGYVEDINGNLVKPGKYANAGGGVGGEGDGEGTGGKKGKKTPLDLATSSVMDAIKESAESKTLNADQLIGVQATARELVANAARNNQQLDPYVAGRIALTAVLKPESVKPSYNSSTGTFENTVSYNGNTFSVGKIDQTAMPDSQLKGVAQAFVSKLPAASRAELIKAAAGDKAVIDKINADIVAAHGKQWADQFTATTGRRPTQQDIQASIARTQAVVGQNIQLVGASGAVEQDKKQRDTAARNQATATAKAEIGTPAQIMALPPGKAAEIYRQYGGQTDAFQREALQMKMQQDRRQSMTPGGIRQN